MKRTPGNIYVLLCTLLCLFFSSNSHGQQTLTQINGWNAYVHLPASYSSTSTSYPTIIFFPGLGEVGTSAGAVITYGPGAYISQGWNGNVVVDGNTVEFIVISLQPPAAYPTEAMMNEKIQTIKSLYRVNNNKLYLTGLSMGGWCSTTFVTGDPYGGPYTYASQIAAVVEVEGVTPDDNTPYPNLFDNFALSGGRLLGFEQIYDNRGMPTRIDRMNATKANSGIYVQTNFGGGGHCCWSNFYGGGGTQPGIFTLDGINQNLYQWLARQTKGVTTIANTPPTANAGADQTITLPTSSVTLNGSGTDAGGSVASYQWTKIYGPAGGSITSASSASSSITSLAQGTYTYQLKVTDNLGSTSTDNVDVIVNGAVTLVAGSCNTNAPVTYYLSQTGPGEIYRPNGSLWKGGDTVKITGTSYSVIEFNNIGGDACRPLVIMPMTTVSTPVFRFKGNAHNIRLWGGPTPYGIKVTNGSMAISLGHHIEVDNVECYGGSTGVYCKQDVVYADRTTWANSTNTMTKMTFKNMWIHDVHGEGMYVGITQPDGLTVTSTYSGLDTTIVPIRLDSVEISNCLVERTDWDGIQLSNARNGCKIFNNTVRNYGLINMSTQQAGIILGSNTNGDVYNNSISKGTGNGIEAFGYGLLKIYGNTLDSCGLDGHINPNGTTGQHSLYVSDFLITTDNNPKQTVNIYNNAVNHPPTAGGIFVSGYYFNSYPSSVYNNTLCIPNAPANWLSTYVLANVAGSTTTNNTLSCTGSINTAPTANAGVDIIKVLPSNSATVNGSGNDTDGSIAGYLWRKVSGPETGLIVSPTAASTIISGLVQGIYLFELQVTDNSGAIGKDTMQFTVNSTTNAFPVANAGANQTITLPTSQVTLVGTGTDADGTIAAYQWSQMVGYGGVITSPNSATTTVTGLTQGSYQYQLKVTDNGGYYATSLITVTVNAATTTTTTGKAIRVNVYGGSNPSTDLTWNNWNFNAGLTSSSLLYEDRSASTVSANITGEILIVDNGTDYSSASVTPPPVVLRYNSASTSYRTLVLRGLSPSKKYRVEFYGSRKNTGNKTTFFVGNLSDTISTDSNVSDYAKFDGIIPDNSGNVSVVIDKIGTYQYLAGFSIIEQGTSGVAAKTSTQAITQTAIAADNTIASLSPGAASVYPNPFNTAFKVQITDMAAGTYSLVLSDISGKTILTKKVVKSSGPVTENVQTNNIPAGVYILQVINANGTKTAHKLVKN